MADTTGYYLFGGRVDDYARVLGSDELIRSQPLTITDPATSATITDLLDASTNPVTSISLDANGEYKFWARLPVVNGQASGGGIYTLIATSALITAAGVGNLTAQVNAAQAAAAAAASAATAAAASAAASIPSVQKGAAGGVGSLDSTGHLNGGQESQNTLDRLDALEAAGGGSSGGGGDHQIFQFSTTATPPSLIAGTPGGEWVSPSVDTLLDSIYMALDDYSPSVASTFDVQINVPPYAGFVSMYAGVLPSVPVNNYSAFGLAAPSPAVPAKSLLRVVPTVVAPASTASVTAAALKGTQGSQSSGTGTGSSIAHTMPTGGATGDTVLVAVAHPGSTTASMPAGWTKILDQADPGSGGVTRAHLSIFVAAWTGALVPTVTLSAGASYESTIRLISGADPATIVAIGKGDYQAGVSDTGPSGAAPVTCDLILEFAAIDFPNPTAVPSGTAETSTPTGWAEDYDHYTTRATIRNVGLVHGHATGVTSGTSVGAITWTISGTSLGTNESWALGRVFIVRAAGTHGPNRARVQLNLV